MDGCGAAFEREDEYDDECVLPGGVGVGGRGRKHAENSAPGHGCRRIGRSSARSNLQRGIKLEHRRCNRIEGST